MQQKKKVFRKLEDIEGSKTDYSKSVYKSGDNNYFDFTNYGPLSSLYLKLISGDIGISLVKIKYERIQKRDK